MRVRISPGQGFALLTSLGVAFGLVLLSPADMWDGRLADYGIATRNPQLFFDWMAVSNWWLLYWAYSGVIALQAHWDVHHLVLSKSVMLLSLLGLGYEVGRFARSVLGFSHSQAVAAVCLLWVLPFWPMLHDSIHVIIVFVWLVLHGHRLMHEAKHPLARAWAWLAVILSFQLNSVFAFVLGLEFARWGMRSRQQAWNWWRSAALLATAVACYAVLRTLLAPSGAFVGYNNIMLPGSADAVKRLLGATAMFFTWVVFPLPLLALALSARAGRQAFLAQTKPIVVLTALCGFAAVAYVAVGKGGALWFPAFVAGAYTSLAPVLASDAGQSGVYSSFSIWVLRHAVLFIVPLALLCVALVAVLPRWRNVALALVWVHAAIWCTVGHIKKLDHTVFESQVVAALSTLPALPGGRVLLQAQSSYQPQLSVLETNHMLWRAYGNAQYLATLQFGPQTTRGLQAAVTEVTHTLNQNPALAPLQVMLAWPLGECVSTVQLFVPDRTLSLALTAYQPLASANAAKVVRVESNCPRG